MPLTPRQQRFVDAYAGNGADAARIAGYTGNVQVLSTQAARLLKKAEVQEAISKRQKPKDRAVIANREDRQKFWTRIMRSKSREIGDRLKASELLGKSEADFTDKHEHVSKDGIPLVVFLPEKKQA